MNKKILIFISIWSTLYSALECSLGHFLPLKKLEQPYTFAEHVKKDIETLQAQKMREEEAYSTHKAHLEVINRDLAALKEKAKNSTGTELDFINQKLALETHKAQVMTEIEQVHHNVIAHLDAHIKLLQEYKEDPEFKHKQFYLPPKSIYSIDDIQKLDALLVQYDGELKQLKERLDKAIFDVDNAKKNQILAKQEYEEKKREQREFKNREGSIGETEQALLTLVQQGELLDEQEQLAALKKELADVRAKEIDYKIQLLEEQIKIVNLQLEALTKEHTRVKQELHVDEKDIHNAETAFKGRMQESIKIQEDYTRRIGSLDLLKENELNQIKNRKRQYNLSDADMEAIGSWLMQPKTISGWTMLLDIGRLINHSVYEIDNNREYFLAQIDYEKAKLYEFEIATFIVATWYKLIKNRLAHWSRDEITKEIKRYEKAKADLQTHISYTSDKKSLAVGVLNANARLVEALKATMKRLKDQRDTVFKDHQTEYNRFIGQLKDEIFEDAPRRGEIIAQLIELYTITNTLRHAIIKKIDGMIAELKAKAQWTHARPLWKGLKNFIPDIKLFITYSINQPFSQILDSYRQTIQETIATYVTHPMLLVPFFIQIAILILFFVLIKLYLPDIHALLSVITPRYSIGYTITVFLNALIMFIQQHLTGLFLWTVLFIALHYGFIHDPFISSIFYLCSIIFWLIYAYLFIQLLKKINIQQGYVFASKRYQYRLWPVVSFLAYTTIVIVLFREAFLQAPFLKSDVPRILLALNFIILQISLILLIQRDQILSLIPRSTPLWQWVYDHVKKYYYIFLVAALIIIIMSNPYVGYGPQVFYSISRLLIIIIVIQFFSAVHTHIKRNAASFFFYSDGDIIKERFPYGRTSYGIFVIFSFLCFVTIAGVIAANIMGYSLSFHDIFEWLRTEIYGFKDDYTGRHIKVTALSIAQVVIYGIAGITVAYALNRFVLGRIFDLLLVNIGVQNAILSLTRYAIVLTAIIIGLKSLGLSSALVYVFAVIGGLGVAGKEIITDFIGYFIILIQRPIKIGDYVRLDEEMTGVVRYITLRSVVLRRKNSVTVIIPNSYVMTKPVVNWNYSRTFFAFDDIILTVPYTSDPTLVKELILKVLTSHIHILKNPAPIVQLRDFTDNGFLFLIRGFLSPDKILEQWDIASDVRLELVRVLRQHNISVASPTRIVKILSPNTVNNDILEP